LHLGLHLLHLRCVVLRTHAARLALQIHLRHTLLHHCHLLLHHLHLLGIRATGGRLLRLAHWVHSHVWLHPARELISFILLCILGE